MGAGDRHLRVHISDPARADRAAALLGPLGGLRRGTTIDLHVEPAARTLVPRLLARLDDEGIAGRLEAVETLAPARAEPEPSRSLAADWDGVAAALPADWSEAYLELELESSDHVAPAALHLAPCNPLRHGLKALRFRTARNHGYGTAPQMVRRCLERLDEERIRGSVRAVFELSETNHVRTQGPVFYVGGRVV